MTTSTNEVCCRNLNAMAGKHFLKLTDCPIRFEPVNNVTNVFFDDSRKQVFVVRSGGATGVTVKGPTHTDFFNFRMEDRGEVLSIKFSLDGLILAVQRSPDSVEFINFKDKIPIGTEFSQTCRGKSTKIHGFIWTGIKDVAFITDQGVEIYQVLEDKHQTKLIKHYSTMTNWMIWNSHQNIALLSVGQLGQSLLPIIFHGATFAKLPKFELNRLPNLSTKQLIPQRDVSIATLYEIPYVIILQHEPSGTEVALYQLHQQVAAVKTHTLQLSYTGRFAINIVDNIVIVHHQLLHQSLVFDIAIKPYSGGSFQVHEPFAPSLSIEPCTVLDKSSVPGLEDHNIPCELYSPNWIFFQPNIVIDAKMGCMWYINLDLCNFPMIIVDRITLFNVLVLRSESKCLLLQCIMDLIIPNPQPLCIISKVFDLINKVYIQYMNLNLTTVKSSPARKIKLPQRVIIDQSDLYSQIFSKVMDNGVISDKFLLSVVIEYLSSLNANSIPIQHFLYELCITLFVRQRQYYQLHQFLQYHVINDSKPLACLLLSLEALYAPAHQLALDMLKRLSTATEQIVEVLLSKNMIITALRFLRSEGAADSISARKFLESARNTDDPMLFFSVYKFFEQRNVRMRGDGKFLPGEHCDDYVNYYIANFGIP